MNYALSSSKPGEEQKRSSVIAAVRRMWPLIAPEKWHLAFAFVAIVANSVLSLSSPRVIGHAIDAYVLQGDLPGVYRMALLLFGIYFLMLYTSYAQTKIMGGVGQRVLFSLRNAVFAKLQSLPVAFFTANKAGDLISRINNDTDKLNQFFSQALVQIAGNLFVMLGAAGFLLSLNVRLGAATLAPAVVLLAFTQLTGSWVRRRNAAGMSSSGSLSAAIQEGLHNFKVIVAFNRRDYFRRRFAEANQANYASSVGSGLANSVFTPVYGLASSIAQLVVMAYGLALISQGQFTLGLMVSFLSYANSFYMPLRQLAALWTSFQTALAAWDRVSDILSLESDLALGEGAKAEAPAPVLEFRNVHFRYPDGKEVLHGISFALEHGKTYALVGPTGGGKTTTASLMARLFDPTEGMVLLDGQDIRAIDEADRTAKVGFILQEPFLFAGTVRENVAYGHPALAGGKPEDVDAAVKAAGLDGVLARFDQGLDTAVSGSAESMSLGQRQLVAFVRAVLRKPDVLILDEATANVDTVTEQLLGQVLAALPATTTRVVIAHRLNTIQNADEIFFVNGGEVVRAGSFDHAVEMLLKGKRAS
jgi:ATP-binding cassette subfamily B protein